MKFAPGSPSSDGVEYRFDRSSVSGAVQIALSDDGMSWRVRFSVGGITHGQHDSSVRIAFRRAAEFALEQSPAWAEWLNVEDIERELDAVHALDPDRPVLCTKEALVAMGVALSHPDPIDARALEEALRSAHFMKRMEGMRSAQWRVLSAAWIAEDHVEIGIHRGV